MHLNVVVICLSFMAISASPLHRAARDATRTDSMANLAHEKADLTKAVENLYKTNMDGSDLYNQEDANNKNPVAEEVQRKLNAESERLRLRLRQELSELQQRLSQSPDHLSSALASMRERLAPLTQQLQSSLSSSTQDLCGQLSLYLQEAAQAQAEAGGAGARRQEALLLMTQALEHSGAEQAGIIGHFQTGVTEQLGASEEEEVADLWRAVSSRLRQEVSALGVELRNKAGALREELAAAPAAPFAPAAASSVERFCQRAASHSQEVQARMEKRLQGLEEELEAQRASGPSPSSSSSSSTQPAGSLRDDFSEKLSALILDILHSV